MNVDDGTIAAVVIPAVEGASDTFGLLSNDVDDVSGSVIWKYDVVVDWNEMI